MATIANLRMNLSLGTAEFDGKPEKAERALARLKNQAFRTFLDTQTPLEQYTYKLDRLNKMHEAGLISTTTYGRALRQLKSDFDSASQGAEKVSSVQDKLAGAIGAGNAAVVRAGAALQAVRGIFSITSAVVAAGSNDWDAFNKSLSQLPFGLGAVYQSMYQLGDMITGTSDKITKLKEAQQALLAEGKKIQEANAANDALRAMAAGMRDQTSQIGLTGFTKERADVDNQYLDRLEQIAAQEEKIKAAGYDPSKDRDVLAAKDAARQMRARQMEDIGLREQADADKRREQAEREQEQRRANSPQARMEDFNRKLSEQIMLMQSASREAAEYERLRNPSVTASEDAKAREMLSILDGLKRRNELEKEAKRLIEDNKSSQERFNEKANLYAEMLANNMITLEQYGSAMEKLQREQDGGRGPVMESAGGLSDEFRRGLVDTSAIGVRTADPTTQKMDELKEQQRETNRLLRAIADRQGLN